MNTILSNLKRRSRSRTKPEFTSPSKAKPLDILPGLLEEDDERRSISSARSASPYLSPTRARRSFVGSATVGGRRAQDVAERKRDSRRVVLTGAEGLTFDDFFPLYDEPPRPAPVPLCTKASTSSSPPPRPLSDFSSKSIVCDNSLDELDNRMSRPIINFDFPTSPSTTRTCRSQSPTPSCASSRTTSTTASSSSSVSLRNGVITPLTSDDELHKPQSQPSRIATFRSRRESMLSIKLDFSRSMQSLQCDDDADELNDFEDAAWITQIISDAFTLTTPSSPVTPSNIDLRARPDSIPPPPRMRTAGRSRFSKPLPVVPRASIPQHPIRGPSIQLDPTFHTHTERHFTIPSRSPPPPPIRVNCPSPTMEEKTEELLQLLANAAMDGGFLGTGLSGSLSPLPPSLPVTPSSAYIPDTPSQARPLPRMSLPADIDDGLEPAAHDESEPATATGSIFDFHFDDPLIPRTPTSLSLCSQSSAADVLPGSPFTFSFEMLEVSVPSVSDVPLVGSAGMYDSPAPERVLRSRWSSSTLSSLVDAHQIPHSASSWMTRFNLGSGSPTKKAKAKSSGRPSFSRPSLKLGLPHKSPASPTFKRSADLERRDSCNSGMSDCGSDSGDSTASSGLRRKPIPIEIFMR